jgi:ABC-2 type transport system ATP-binding protein
MQEGRLVASGRIAELVGPARSVHLEVGDRARAVEALHAIPEVRRVADEDLGLRAEGDGLRPMTLFSALDSAGVEVRAFREGRNLEEAYLELVRTP